VFEPYSGPSRATRGQRYWQPAKRLRGDIKRRSPLAGSHRGRPHRGVYFENEAHEDCRSRRHSRARAHRHRRRGSRDTRGTAHARHAASGSRHSCSMTRLAIMVGGAVGAVARHGVSAGAAVCCASTWPWATLLVNASGSWALGLFMWILPSTSMSPVARAGLTIGLCGGFTTFSTFSIETLTLARTGHVSLAAAYVSASVCLTVVGVFAGMRTGAVLMRRRWGMPQAASPRDARSSPESEHPRQRCRPTEDRR
jgi:fluoride exporter